MLMVKETQVTPSPFTIIKIRLQEDIRANQNKNSQVSIQEP